ncbi:MAG TPA: response regulator [Gemmataceae bacterium]|nr:response regulator [Gemmataceae bacterium]
MTATPPAPLRIAVADDDRDVREFLERFLPILGHTVHSVARTGRELLEHCRVNQPDMIIADVKMPDMNGLEAVEEVNRMTPIPVILVTGHSVPNWVDKARELGVMAYLVKPVTEYDLAPAIALAWRHFEELQSVRRESADLRQALEDRKLIERAKEAVALRVGIPEAEAYRRMRKVASNGNRKLVEIARQVLTAEEVFHAFEEPSA